MTDPAVLPYLSAGLLEQFGDAVLVLDSDWRYVFVSGHAAELIGRPLSEILGRSAAELFPEQIGTPQHDACVQAVATGTRQRLVWFHAPSEVWLEQLAIPVGDALVVLVNDVTERQLAGHRSEQLVRVGETLAEATSESEVNEALVHEVLPLVGATGGSILLADEERSVMQAVGWHGMADDFNDTWREFPMEVDTPSVRAWRTGAPVFVESLAQAYADFPAIAPELERIGRHTVAAIPLTAAGARLGALVVNFSTSRRLGTGDREFLTTTAAMAAQAVTRARLLAAEKRSIAELQRSLLPRRLPQVEGLSIAVRYLASDSTAQIGGDWYDVVPLSGGSVGLVMGDVEGHDLAAAALMGLVRSAVRAYAVEGHPPAFVLQRANSFLAGLARDRIVTVSYCQLHPRERLVTTVSAGHPGTLVAAPDGSSCEIPVEVGPPLGVFDSGMRWSETTSTLPAGAVLAVFTDGLVEVRGEDISDGLERLRRALVDNRDLPPDVLADLLLTTRGAGGHDDVALLTARLTAPADPNRRFVRRLPATPASVFLARRFTEQLLTSWQLPADQIDTAALVVSELATNAARHSEDAIEIGVSCTDQLLRLDVGDTSHRMPVGPAPDVDEEATSGRGLILVESLAARWGVDSDGLSKVVWAEFDL